MNRNLVILGGGSSALRTSLEKNNTVSDALINTEGPRIAQVDNDNLVFIDAESFGESNVANDKHVITALERGIPIVIAKPSAKLLTVLTGCGSDNAEAVLIVKGKGRNFYSMSYLDPSTQITESHVAQAEVPEDQRGENETIQAKAPSAAVVSPGEDADLSERVLADLGNIVNVESKLNDLYESPFQRNNIPENRKWSEIWETDWVRTVRSDPSNEQSKTQTLRFRYTSIFRLLAANEPVKVKVFTTEVGGTGFDPVIEGESMIRNDEKHRGWAQSLTSIEFSPQGNEFGNVQDYVPVNQANEVSVSAGYHWELGFTGGGGPEGPEGSVSFAFGQDSSHTKSSKDFRTLTAALGDYGMRFYHNANIVGGDTEIDARNLFGSEWTNDMAKMFYYHFPSGQRVRSWPSLSRQLLKPDSECVWYAGADETREGVISWQGRQGINYCYTKSSTNYCWNYSHYKGSNLKIDLGVVDYNDPDPPA